MTGFQRNAEARAAVEAAKQYAHDREVAQEKVDKQLREKRQNDAQKRKLAKERFKAAEAVIHAEGEAFQSLSAAHTEYAP